jgi:hypothetical protein
LLTCFRLFTNSLTVGRTGIGGQADRGGPGASGPRRPRSTSAAWLTSRQPLTEPLSGVTPPGGPTAPADLLAREPRALPVRA